MTEISARAIVLRILAWCRFFVGTACLQSLAECLDIAINTQMHVCRLLHRARRHFRFDDRVAPRPITDRNASEQHRRGAGQRCAVS